MSAVVRSARAAGLALVIPWAILWVLGAAPAAAADHAPRVGLVTTVPATRDAFVSGLEALGYEDGRTVTVDWRRAPEDGAGDIAARALGVTVPPSLLARADKIIE